MTLYDVWQGSAFVAAVLPAIGLIVLGLIAIIHGVRTKKASANLGHD